MKKSLNKFLKNKNGFELRFWIISLILFSGIFGLLVIAFQDIVSPNNYDVPNLSNPTIESQYNQLQSQENLIGNLSSTISGPGGLKPINTLGTVFTATIGILNLVFSSLNFIPETFINFGSTFGIPTTVSRMFFTIVFLIFTTLIIFSILNSIRK